MTKLTAPRRLSPATRDFPPPIIYLVAHEHWLGLKVQKNAFEQLQAQNNLAQHALIESPMCHLCYLHYTTFGISQQAVELIERIARRGLDNVSPCLWDTFYYYRLDRAHIESRKRMIPINRPKNYARGHIVSSFIELFATNNSRTHSALWDTREMQLPRDWSVPDVDHNIRRLANFRRVPEDKTLAHVCQTAERIS